MCQVSTDFSVQLGVLTIHILILALYLQERWYTTAEMIYCSPLHDIRRKKKSANVEKICLLDTNSSRSHD